MMNAERPLTVLIAALGGEGGGVLTAWIVAAARAEGLVVQSTSIPGVAQRTGATTYYLELFPKQSVNQNSRQPVMALTPFPGNVDVMLASELVEAGRAIQSGYVTSDRTTLIASTHRVYAMSERIHMADSRHEPDNIFKAAEQMAERTVLFDMEHAARSASSAINAVMLGALAGSNSLPISRECFVQAIQDTGISVEANLSGFSAGYEGATRGTAIRTTGTGPDPDVKASTSAGATLLTYVQQHFPHVTHATVMQAVARLVDYQDMRYAKLFLDRLEPILEYDRSARGDGRDWMLTIETARYLAARMAYEDIIWVADLKTRAERFERVRHEVKAEPGEPVVISEFLKPGIEEFCSVLPGWLARPIIRWQHARALQDRLNLSMRVKTSTISGFVLLRLVAKLRVWRSRCWRYAEEQSDIERWLDAVRRAAYIDYDFGLEAAQLARLIKGYGSTRRLGRTNSEKIMQALVNPALDSGQPANQMVARARQAALADPDGKALDQLLREAGVGGIPTQTPEAA